MIWHKNNNKEGEGEGWVWWGRISTRILPSLTRKISVSPPSSETSEPFFSPSSSSRKFPSLWYVSPFFLNSLYLQFPVAAYNAATGNAITPPPSRPIEESEEEFGVPVEWKKVPKPVVQIEKRKQHHYNTSAT
jgi:hypothetical protein